MDINEKNFKKLERLMNLMDDDALTREEFLKSFKAVLEFAQKMKQQNMLEMERMEKVMSNLMERMKMESKTGMEDIRKQIMFLCEAEMKKMQSEHEKMMTQIDKKMMDIKDGKDADETKIVSDVLSLIKIPEYKETILDNAEKIRDKLETLQGEEKLDRTAVRGITVSSTEPQNPKEGDIWIKI